MGGHAPAVGKENEERDDFIGSGMDCAVIPLNRHKSYSLVQTVDFFYPLVDDPYVMGKIALANVVSDVYAVGVTDIDKLNMLITAPTEFNEQQRDTIIPMIVEGFQESAKMAGCRVSIRSISINPWCIIGGIASSVCKKGEVIMPSNAKDGDSLVLTKPLGTHLATNALIWMQERNGLYQKLCPHITDADIEATFKMAVKSMTYLNKTAALLMHKHGAHAATDVTGFGLLGHAKNLAQFQKDVLTFEIEAMPVLRNVMKIGEIIGQNKKFKAGTAVETSGGLLICLPADNAPKFCSDFKTLTDGDQSAWVIGRVKRSNRRDAVVVENVNFIEINF